MGRQDPTLSHATPYYLRALRNTRLPEWVDTPQGKILRQVENRLQQILVEEKEVQNLPLIIAELDRIKARATALAKPAPKEQVQVPKKSKKAKEVSLEESMIITMEQYIDTGDITHIVPEGAFSSAEEKKLWSYFTMADVKSVKGRTIVANKMSTGKPVDTMVLDKSVKVEPGCEYALLQDPTGVRKVIIAAIPLGEDAPNLSRTFNSLYRK